MFLWLLHVKINAVVIRDVARPDSRAPALGESRSRVLAALQDSNGPLGVDDVAKVVRLHPNTARFHLDGLVEAGLVRRDVEAADRPGRPRALYVALPGSATAGQRSYRLLAEILTSHMAAETPRPAQAARRAGEVWGRYLVQRPPPYKQIDADDATRQLVDTLDEIGFSPEAATTDGQHQILLHHCPFREAAEQHREVVCSVHLGLMQGLLAELGAPVKARRLDPFVEPNLCVTQLSRTDSGKPVKARRAG